MGPADYDLLSGMDPAALQQLLGMGTLDEKQALLLEQLAQAEALRSQQATPHTTGMGAALGGLGNVLSGVSGDLQASKARGGVNDILGQKDAGRSAYVDALVKALGKRKMEEEQSPLLRQAQQNGQQLPVPFNTQGGLPFGF